jgi:hypothetical protein
VFFDGTQSAKYFISKYVHQVIELKSSHYLCKLETQIGQDLPEDVKINVTGRLKLACQKDKNETVAVGDDNNEDNVGDENDGDDDDDDDSGKDDNAKNKQKRYLVFQQDLLLVSMDWKERNVTFNQPIILEKSRSPYILTIDLEYTCADSVQMKTGQTSEKTFTSDHGVFEVEDIRGNFAGVRSLCFENMSNRDEC